MVSGIGKVAYGIEENSGADVSELLEVTSVILSQGDERYDVLHPSGDKFDFSSDNSFGVQFEFDVPVHQNMGNNVKYGDYAEFLFAKNLEVKGNVFNNKLPMIITEVGNEFFGKELGYVTLESRLNSDNETEIYARISFTGDNDFFDEDVYSVSGAFQYDFDFSGENEAESYENTFIIFEEEFSVEFPAIETNCQLKKRANFNKSEKTITWASTASRYQGETQFSLDEFTFTDDLTNVGEYVEGSFAINNVTAHPIYENGILSYTFPENSGTGPKTITFDTVVKGEEIIQTKEYKNTAQLTNDDGINLTANATIKPKTEWISKNGHYNDEDGKIYYTIECNPDGYTFDTIYILERNLPDSVYIEKASYTEGVWSEESQTYIWGDEYKNIEFYDGANKAYRFENVDSPILLKLVVCENMEYEGDPNRIHNTASLSLDGQKALVSATATVRGLNDYLVDKNIKSLTSQGTNEISIKVESEGADFEVYDMICYEKIDEIDEILDTEDATINQKVKDALIDLFESRSMRGNTTHLIGEMKGTYFGNRYYDEGELVVIDIPTQRVLTEGVEYNFSLHPLRSRGEEVGEMVRVHFKEAGEYKITFRTTPTDPLVMAGNFDNKMKTDKFTLFNRAYIVDNNSVRAQDDAINSTYSVMFDKDTMSNTISANTSFTQGELLRIAPSQKDGYNYQDNSILYRIAVNHCGRDTYDALGAMQVVDTLPLGFTLKEFENGEYFQIYRASEQLENNLNFKEIYSNKLGIEDGVDHINVEIKDATFDANGQPLTQEIITFTFNETYNGDVFKLNDPYAIFLKMEICEATLKELTLRNSKTDIKNNAKWIVKDFNTKVDEDVKIDVPYTNVIAGEETTTDFFEHRILQKKHDYIKNGNNAIVNWEIIYDTNRLNVSVDKVILRDTLSHDIALFRNSDGGLDYSKLKLIEITFNDVKREKFTEVSGTEVELTSSNATFNEETRQLSVKIPDPTVPYVLRYQTIITGIAGKSVTNRVEILGLESQSIETSGGFEISNASASASMKMGGSFKIHKVDYFNQNLSLQGTVFSLYSMDSNGEKGRMFSRKTTNEKGEARFICLPHGRYILEESTPSDGYKKCTDVFVVQVNENQLVTVRKKEGGKNLLKGTTFTVENISNASLVTNVVVRKVWEDNESRDLEAIDVKLYRSIPPDGDNELVDTVQITQKDLWEYTFYDLPIMDENMTAQYEYTVEENLLEGFESNVTGNQESGFVITNTYVGGGDEPPQGGETTKLIDVFVEKKWIGDNESPIDSVEITLYRGIEGEPLNEKIETVQLQAEEGWTHTFIRLEQFNGERQEYVYAVVETPVEGYESTIDGNQREGFIITNTLIETNTPIPTIDIPIMKIWRYGNTGNNKSVEVVLYRREEGEPKKAFVQRVKILAVDNWQYTFRRLEPYNEKGIAYVYSIDEVENAGYTSEITGNQTQGFIIVNTAVAPIDTIEFPQTGDDSKVMVWTMLTVASSGSFICLWRRDKKKRDKKKRDKKNNKRK